MSNFAFLAAEWPQVHEAAARAEAAVHPDPRTACFYARRALELAVHWAYRHDSGLRVPYQDNLSALIHEPTFKQAAGEAVFTKARVIVKLGNEAVHSPRPVRQYDALSAVRELFHVCWWLAHTYARGARPAPGLAFDPAAVPQAAPDPRHTAEQLRALQARLEERDESLAALLADRGALDDELQRLRAEVAAARREAAARPDTHDYSEAETRDYFIDLLLREAGWALDQARDREFPVTGMPTPGGAGRVDYVLWGDDGRPLALVEAKRARVDPRAGQQQAKLYADCLEQAFGRRPVIFYSNGYAHWLWDDTAYPPRQVQGFYKKAELELLIQRRAGRRPLGPAQIDPAIVERHYQTRAIRRVAEAFERDRDRRALLVMATGAGKTRTVIALCDLLMRCNWVKRVLFLADRRALVRQASSAFLRHLPDSSPVNLLESPDAEGRVFVSTYPTIMGMIDETKDGQRRFGVGHFDLVIIDEAHRSIFQKYRAIFDYFDALLVGLTATPREEIDRNTYSLFQLENGVPTDAYSLDEAVADGYLVPAKAVSVPLRFQREGIRYDDLPEDERDQWDALEWDEDGTVPDRVEAEAVNRWLFNQDTADKVLTHLMTRGLRVAGGDRLGKTIIFARNRDHARFIAWRFGVGNPELPGDFAQVITSDDPYAQSLIDAFANPERAPHVAISVDMLDTGIDVPEVVNLVFFKLVRSRTKFWQMVGRGTRLAPDLFGPGRDKEFFYLFDYCQNLEHFSQNPAETEGGGGESLGRRLFRTRLALAAELDQKLVAEGAGTRVAEDAAVGEPATEAQLYRAVTDRLHGEVAAMNLENFVVRPRRHLVEKYARRPAWANLSPDRLAELAEEVAGLPSELPPEPEEARRFDLLILHLQLALLRGDPRFERLREQVVAIAGLLEEKGAVPGVRAQMPLIQEVQTDAWWEGVTLPMLERVRRRLRDLVRLIDRQRRRPVYTDFEDALGDERQVELPGLGAAAAGDLERFRRKARAFLRAHEDHVALRRLRMDHPLTPTDLAELERMLLEAGVGSEEELRRAQEESQGLGLFVRSLVGLDREAAKRALAGFMSGKALGGNQVEFLNLVTDHLTQQGYMPPERLYESPFTDLNPRGVDGVFPPEQATELIRVLDEVRRRAVA
ncbi:MAG TPA: DEAD/DEAH box helicase family protein [Longimicrobium sp.]|nr:DEAD/DEAH box helicase family protein [Longimicrobium sp.]